MANLKIGVRGFPAGTDKWLLWVHDGIVFYPNRMSDPKPLNEQAAFDLPPGWKFPAGFWFKGWDANQKKFTYIAQNISRHINGFVDIPGIPALGSWVWDARAQQFVRPPRIEAWMIALVAVILIGIVLVAKRK